MTDYKFCKKCNIRKEISNFAIKKNYRLNKFKEKINYESPATYCRECDSKRLKELKKLYPERKKVIKQDGSVGWGTYLRKLRSDKKSTIKLNEFKGWLLKQKDKCSYCGFTLEETKKVLKIFLRPGSQTNSNKFQIDRKNNEKGYSLDNICFACAICNTHKRDFFNHQEFKEIAETYIKPKIQKYLEQ